MAYKKKKNLKGKVADKINAMKLTSDSDVEKINFKERFGEIPKSIMKFSKDKELMEFIDYDKSSLGTKKQKRGGGFHQNMRYSIYNPSQAKFIIDYYTRKNDLILDPFSGRVTRPLITLKLKRKYIGFDTCAETIKLNKKMINKRFPNKNTWRLYNEDGTELSRYKEKKNKFDAIFTCPPYYKKEKYSGASGDLSYMSTKQYHDRICIMFINLARLIKPSDYKNNVFKPVIITVGSQRKGQDGLLDMDYIFHSYAQSAGLTLYDKMITENLAPGAGFTFRRNYLYRFVCKNYETTLVFLKL